MSIYRYTGHSAINEVTFHHDKNRIPIALLAAAPDAPVEQLPTIRRALDNVGWQSVPVYVDGRPFLQVSGFKQESELDNFLQRERFAEGKAAITRQPEDDTKPGNLGWIKRMSLKLAGLFNMVGTLGLFGGGIKEKDPYRITGGSLYLLGEGNLVRYGNAKPERYVREVAEDLGEFIRGQGGSLPENSSLSDIMQHKPTGLLAKADNFLYRNPAQLTLGLSSGGAASVLLSGVQQVRKNEGFGKLGFGIGSLALKLISMVVPEKSHSEIQQIKSKPQNLFQKAVTWIQEKPLRFYGIGSLIIDVFLPLDAYQQYKREPGKKGWIYTAIAGLSYILADIMYSISNKDHTNEAIGKFTPDEQRSIEAMAAESIAAQPEESRGLMAQKLGKFLTTRKEVHGDADSISRSIIEQARHIRDNPWASRITNEEFNAAAR